MSRYCENIKISCCQLAMYGRSNNFVIVVYSMVSINMIKYMPVLVVFMLDLENIFS